MKKLCGDKQCSRAGQMIPFEDFPRDRRRGDGRYIYCKLCCKRRERLRREAKGAREYQRREQGEPDQAPMTIAYGFAFSLVYNAISRGLRTREQIHRETGVDYDMLGDILVELIFDCKAVRIEDREFRLVEEQIFERVKIAMSWRELNGKANVNQMIAEQKIRRVA